MQDPMSGDTFLMFWVGSILVFIGVCLLSFAISDLILWYRNRLRGQILTSENNMNLQNSVTDYYNTLDKSDVGLLAKVVEVVELPVLEAAMRHSGYNRARAAKTLGLTKAGLQRRLKSHGLI